MHPPSGPGRGLRAFHVADLSFVGTQDGWALGTATCRAGRGRCAALARTTDGARTWRALPPPPGGVVERELESAWCAAPCLESVRFATDEIGYLSGSGNWGEHDAPALYLTTDGGKTWTREPGGADALETLDGNVIRVVGQGGCPPGCRYHIEIAQIGSTDWHGVHLPGPQGSGGPVTLVRTGHAAAIEDYGNPAGGALAEAVLWTSIDDGATWTNRGEPCPQGRHVSTPNGFHGEVDSEHLTSTPVGSLLVLCQPRGSSHGFVIVSTDGGRSFRTDGRVTRGLEDAVLIDAGSRSDVFAVMDALYRNTEDGRGWQRVQQNSSRAPLDADWIGFETTTVGRVVEPPAVPSGRTSDLVWTTTDGGATWRCAPIG